MPRVRRCFRVGPARKRQLESAYYPARNCFSPVNRDAARPDHAGIFMRERTGEGIGVLAALLSSALGGVAAGATRFVVADVDPITLGALRFGGGFLVLLPIVL